MSAVYFHKASVFNIFLSNMSEKTFLNTNKTERPNKTKIKKDSSEATLTPKNDNELNQNCNSESEKNNNKVAVI